MFLEIGAPSPTAGLLASASNTNRGRALPARETHYSIT